MTQRLQHLADVMRELAELTAEPQPLLQTLARRIAETLGSYCGIAVLSPDRQRLDPVAVHDPDPHALEVFAAIAPRASLPLDSPHPFARAIADGTPLRLAVTTEMIRSRFAGAEDQEALLALALQSMMSVPLRARGALVGGMFLVRHGPTAPPFEEEDLQLAQSLGDHGALAIANSNLLQQSRRRADRLRLLSELAQEFAASVTDYPALLALVARRLCEVVGDACVIRMIAEDGEHFEMPGTIDHVDPDRRAEYAAVMTAQPHHLSQGVTGHVARTGQSALIPRIDLDQVQASQGDEYRRTLERVGIKSILVVPLRSQGRVIGTCGMCRTRTLVPYADDDRLLLEGVATHASLAIANSRLLEASKRELAERMRTEEVLRRAFLEAAPDAVLITTASGAIELVNSQAERLFGFTRSELVGLPIGTLLPRSSPEMLAAVTSPHGVALELSGGRKDGTTFAAEVTFSAIETPGGRLVAAAVRDITERLREVEERSHRDREASRLKSEFLANMSHELRTPLNAVIGFAALMHSGKAGPMNDLHKEYIADILKSARHLLQLINDVLDLSKIEAGRMEVCPDTTSIAKLVGEVRDIVRGLAVEKRIRIELALDESLPEVVADPRLLKQVLYNYLSNAIKFTPEDGRVTVRVGPADPDWFRIDVADTGIGIAPRDMDRLFVEFQQLEQGATKKHPGTGLGLALVKRMVEAQGGRVLATSVVGTGSTFSAILPRVVTSSP